MVRDDEVRRWRADDPPVIEDLWTVPVLESDDPFAEKDPSPGRATGRQ